MLKNKGVLLSKISKNIQTIFLCFKKNKKIVGKMPKSMIEFVGVINKK